MTRAPIPPQGSDLDLSLARPWPDGVPARQAPNECGYCFHPLNGDRVSFNGCFCHARCAALHERLILGDDAGPGLLEHLDYLDGLDAFLTRLGREAGKLGIDRQKLATAVERAAK